MHLITCKKTCCTTTTRRSSRRRPRRLVPQSPSFTPSTAHPQITVYSSSVRQKISLLRRSRRKKGGGERRGEWSDMDQRQTNWQVIQLTRASLTMERSGGRMPPSDGRTHGINPGHGYVMFLPLSPSVRPSFCPSFGIMEEARSY